MSEPAQGDDRQFGCSRIFVTTAEGNLLQPDGGIRDCAYTPTQVTESERCPICERGRPADIVAELSASWVTAPERAPLAVYACVVSKRHVREPYELSLSEMADFFEDCMLAAKRLSEAFQPVKMNYEIHGNTIPHLHMHLFPRMPEDFGCPIPSEAVYKRSRAELDRIASAVSPQTA